MAGALVGILKTTKYLSESLATKVLISVTELYMCELAVALYYAIVGE